MNTEIVLCMFSNEELLHEDIYDRLFFEYSSENPFTQKKLEIYFPLIKKNDFKSYINAMKRENISPTYAVSIAKNTRYIKDYIKESYELFDFILEHTKKSDSTSVTIIDSFETQFQKKGYAYLNQLTVTNSFQFLNKDHSVNALTMDIILKSNSSDEDFRDIQNYFLKFEQEYPELFLLKHVTKPENEHFIYYNNALCSWLAEQYLKTKLKKYCRLIGHKTYLFEDIIKFEFKDFIPM